MTRTRPLRDEREPAGERDPAQSDPGVVPAVAAPPPGPAARSHPPLAIRGRATDATVIAGYLLAAILVTAGLWRHRERMTVAHNDQILFEWMLAHAAHAVTRLDNPLYSTQLNAPDGVNLMANTSVLGLGIPLTPVTVLAGAQTSFLLAVVGCLAGTASAWYLLLSRRIVGSRPAAALGGLFCGFAPGMIAQAGAHLHMISQFLVPGILWLLFDAVPERARRRGVLLGLLVTYQVFLGEEVLAFVALAAGLFAAGYAVADPMAARRLTRPVLTRLVVGALTALPLLAYPLWFQFFGPAHYRGLPFEPDSYGLDLASFAVPARQAILGAEAVAGRLAPNHTEENSFFGLPLLTLSAVIVLWQWRRPLVKALTVCVVVFAALSLGPDVRVGGEPTGLPGPYRLVDGLPLLDLAVPARFPLVCVPALAILLALSVDRMPRRWPTPQPSGAPPLRLLWTGALVAVLLPVAPAPIRTEPVWPVPQFVASGQWRSYVPPGRTIVPVPPTAGAAATAGMYWSARTDLAFTAPGGYFIGPRGPADSGARWGSPDRPTALLLDRVARTGEAPEVTDEQRRQAIEDLRHWRAAIVVQGGLRHGDVVKQTVDRLLGPGRMISGAWVWDVRALLD